MYQTVSLSGGKDSTAMLLMMLERGEQVDEVITFDFGMEFPEMYAHIDKLERDTGLTFTKLTPPRDFEYYMFDRVRKRGKFIGMPGWGWPRPNARWCTKVKTKTIDDHLKGIDGLVQCVGIAADEPKRVRDKRYPLVEWGITESQALAYCKARGYDWGGLYEYRHRVSCWCCPLGSIDNFRQLRKHHPELWQRLCDMDARAWNTFRLDYTVKRLEERFELEDKQMTMNLAGDADDQD